VKKKRESFNHKEEGGEGRWRKKDLVMLFRGHDGNVGVTFDANRAEGWDFSP